MDESVGGGNGGAGERKRGKTSRRVGGTSSRKTVPPAGEATAQRSEAPSLGGPEPRAPRRAKGRAGASKAKALPAGVAAPEAPKPRRRRRTKKPPAGASTPAFAARRPPRSQPAPEPPAAALVPEAAPVAGLTEEEQIESAKYIPRGLPRLFEEERFLFPETYGVNRVRLLVKDPAWLFAYWDVDPASLELLRADLGERAAALSRLTLRVFDPGNGGMSVILLPEGTRSWYVRTDGRRRLYRAELGVMLPSGEFRRLAQSNTVATPRVGPSPERASRVISYRQAREIPAEAAATAGAEELRAAGAAAGPWSGGEAGPVEAPEPGRGADAPRGGASDLFRR